MKYESKYNRGIPEEGLPSLETDPNKYSIVIMGAYTDKTMREEVSRPIGKKSAICIDTDKNQINIGIDHSVMAENIPEERYVAGVALFDSENKKVSVELYDFRKRGLGEIHDESVKKAIATKLETLFIKD